MKTTIERLGHHGDGIAPGPIFAPLTLPGEEIEGDVESGRMASPRILTPSPNRVKAPCVHFKSCGGCSLQHASDEFVADWKVGVVKFALEAQGISAPFESIQTSPAQSRRRATFSAIRTKKGAIIGFHGRASGAVIAVPECQLVHPDMMATMPAIEAIVAIAGSRKGEIKATVTRAEGGCELAISGGKPLDGALRITLASLVEQFKLARLSWDGEVLAERRAPVQQFGAASVNPPPGTFLQATPEGEAALLAAVTRALGEKPGRIVDLFAGCGTFALPLAVKSEVHAVETEAEMLAALDRGWRFAKGLKKVTTETRDLFRRPLLVDELNKFDGAVIDPPRAGGEAQISELAKSDIKRIAAVSCNPVTFARDASKLIAAGYSLDWVQVVDQFRWSPHVEVAAQFTKGAR